MTTKGSENMEMNLDELIKNIKPSVLTPHTKELSEASFLKFLRLSAKYLIESYVANKKEFAPREIMHEQEIHKIRYFDPKPLIESKWCIVSVLLLHLSYGEQATIIETHFPKKLQLAAKSFAILFTKETNQEDIQIKEDEQIKEKLEELLAASAITNAMLRKITSVPHVDEIHIERNKTKGLVKTMKDRKSYEESYKKSQQAFKYNDTFMQR